MEAITFTAFTDPGVYSPLIRRARHYDEGRFAGTLFGLISWGWTILILGGIEFIVGIGVLAGQKWAAWAGIAFATLNAIGQLLNLPSYPVDHRHLH